MLYVIAGIVVVAVIAFWLFALRSLPKDQRWIGKDGGGGGGPAI